MVPIRGPGSIRCISVLVALISSPVTVRSMRTTSQLRAYTMLEVAATLAVVAILSIMVYGVNQGVERTGVETQSRRGLVALVSAQGLRHDTVGSFASSIADLEETLVNYSYVSGSSPSTSDTELSVSTATVGGEDVVAVAVLSARGRCFTMRSYEPGSSQEDAKRVFEADAGVSCTGQFALTSSGGNSW